MRSVFVVCLCVFLMFSCADSDPAVLEDTSINLKAELLGTEARASTSVNISPSDYSIALVDFWLVDDAGTSHSLLNPDPANPVYTDSSPLLVSFSSGAAEILEDATLPPATYSGYKMRFIYLEMTYPVAFHVPAFSPDSTNVSYTAYLDTINDYRLRLYFNAVGNFWKRDVIVELEAGSDTWYWMRRSLEGDNNTFFLPVAGATHLPGGAGPTSLIDLFSDPEFWGTDDTIDDPLTPIIIDSSSTVGGLNVDIEPFTLTGGTAELVLEVDVLETFNFWEDPDQVPDGVVFNDTVLDLGPGYGGDVYGDQGLHPFLPRFSFHVVE